MHFNFGKILINENVEEKILIILEKSKFKE